MFAHANLMNVMYEQITDTNLQYVLPTNKSTFSFGVNQTGEIPPRGHHDICKTWWWDYYTLYNSSSQALLFSRCVGG